MAGRRILPRSLVHLAEMSWDELRTRGIQEIAKRWDMAAYRLGQGSWGPAVGDFKEPAPRFFFSATELPGLVAALRERFPHEVNAIVDQAERICEHRFDLLGYENLQYDRDIDWHCDVVHGKCAPRKPWYKIRFLDFTEVGDHKIIWELNRHQHLVTLAKAYSLTCKEQFVIELLRQWYHWQRENPYPIGINWASSLEVAFRSLSWLWLRNLLEGCPAVPERFWADSLSALAIHGRHIRRYLSTYFSPNTHLLGEGVGLFFIGALCPQLSRAGCWRKEGWEIVLREARRQIQADGMHFEQSIYYHVYALDFFIHARTLAVRQGIAVPAEFEQRLERMLEFLAHVGQTGVPPRLGDDDGGRVFNPRRNRTEHLLDPLAIGAVLFTRADFKAIAQEPTEELMWLQGAEGVHRFDSLPAVTRAVASARFEPSGICLLGTSQPEPHQLVIDAGPQGTGTAGHGHADALGIQLSASGQEWLIDPGTLHYIFPSQERNLFRGTSAHNTLQVESADQAEQAGPFSWDMLPKVGVEHWATGETFDFFEGFHTGYCRLRPPVIHRRLVFNLKSKLWVVQDRAEGEARHGLRVNWHLAPRVSLGRMDSSVTVFQRDEQALMFMPVENSGWSQELSRGRVSPVYGTEEPNLVLSFYTQAQLPAEITLLLVPLWGRPGAPGRFVRLCTDIGDAAVGFVYNSGAEYHHFFVGRQSKRWRVSVVASDANFLYWGVSHDGGLRHWIMCGGSRVELNGQPIIAFENPIAQWEWIKDKSGNRTLCSDESGLTPLFERGIESTGELEISRVLLSRFD